MFPMCHIYFACEVMGELSDYALLGSIYPDIAISKELDRDITHYNTEDIYHCFKPAGRPMAEFALGAVTHGVDMKGLDYYSDENYRGMGKGYCFYKAEQIEKDVIDCCRIPDKWGLWKAHNFIEMAFELNLYKTDKWMGDRFRLALQNREAVMNICRSLENFYNISAGLYEESFMMFAGFIQSNNVDEYMLVEKYNLQLGGKHGIYDMDKEAAVSTLVKAGEIVEKDMKEFFDYTIPAVKTVIELLK